MKAGLSLGQVARGDISRTAIYFVETGKAKPSQETLELIASRTGQPIDFFLTGAGSADRHPALRIAEMERLLATGDNAGVAAAADSALAQGYDPDSTARIKLLASMARLRMAQPVLGRRLAVEARTYFEKAGDLERVAEALGHEAQAAGLMQDSNAVRIAEGALATCRSLKPIPQLLEARLLRVLGHQLLSSERWAEAIACYDDAIATGEIVQDLQQLSLLYSGLSLAHQELGEINDATRYAQKALTIHETLQDRISQARSLNNLGWMLVKLGDFAAARTNLDRALRILDDQHVEVGKAEFLMSLAALEMAEGRLETATATARRSLDLSTRLDEVSTAAEGYILIAQIAARRGRDVDADEALAHALIYGARAGGARLSWVHEAYAEVLEARGDLAGANRHLKQALTARRPASTAEEIRVATA
jgi:tetratricopeptide (TPR) repeat protein